MSQREIQEILKLSRNEKIELVQILWDDIAKESISTDLTARQIKELDRRLDRISSGDTSFKPWDEIKKKYKFQV